MGSSSRRVRAMGLVAVLAVVALALGGPGQFARAEAAAADKCCNCAKPNCTWKCHEPASCPMCEPVCETPSCRIECEPVGCAKCVVHCAPPQGVEIRCPKFGCTSGSSGCSAACEVHYPPQPKCVKKCEMPKPACKPVCDLKCWNKCPPCPPQCSLDCPNPIPPKGANCTVTPPAAKPACCPCANAKNSLAAFVTAPGKPPAASFLEAHAALQLAADSCCPCADKLKLQAEQQAAYERGLRELAAVGLKAMAAQKQAKEEEREEAFAHSALGKSYADLTNRDATDIPPPLYPSPLGQHA